MAAANSYASGQSSLDYVLEFYGAHLGTTTGTHTMSLGSWDPNAGSASSDLQLTPSLLYRLVEYGAEYGGEFTAESSATEQIEQLQDLLSSAKDEQLSRLMQIDHALWEEAAVDLPEGDVRNLIRFFALVENISGWEAGATSPVIPLAKILRKSGNRLDKPFLQWLRQVNDNRYLPYGPL